MFKNKGTIITLITCSKSRRLNYLEYLDSPWEHMRLLKPKETEEGEQPVIIMYRCRNTNIQHGGEIPPPSRDPISNAKYVALYSKIA